MRELSITTTFMHQLTLNLLCHVFQFIYKKKPSSGSKITKGNYICMTPYPVLVLFSLKYHKIHMMYDQLKITAYKINLYNSNQSTG
jgi:hypothetical protein